MLFYLALFCFGDTTVLLLLLLLVVVVVVGSVCVCEGGWGVWGSLSDKVIRVYTNSPNASNLGQFSYGHISVICSNLHTKTICQKEKRGKVKRARTNVRQTWLDKNFAFLFWFFFSFVFVVVSVILSFSFFNCLFLFPCWFNFFFFYNLSFSKFKLLNCTLLYLRERSTNWKNKHKT